MADLACTCRVLQGPEGPYISGQEHCEVHGPKVARCPDMSSAEFAHYVGRSVNTVCRWARAGHPAARWDSYRQEYRWLPEVYKKALNASTVKPVHPVKKQRGPKPRFAAITGGNR